MHSIRRFAPLCATAADCDSESALRRAESRARRTIHEQDKRGFYMSENKIEIRDMNLYYGDFHALHDINLDIKANEITAFIGPSGCGKSTLLRSLNRMNDLVEGCRITGDIQLEGLYYRYGHTQYAAGHPCFGYDCILPPRRHDRSGRYGEAVLHAARQAYRGLHHGEVRLI